MLMESKIGAKYWKYNVERPIEVVLMVLFLQNSIHTVRSDFLFALSNYLSLSLWRISGQRTMCVTTANYLLWSGQISLILMTQHFCYTYVVYVLIKGSIDLQFMKSPLMSPMQRGFIVLFSILLVQNLYFLSLWLLFGALHVLYKMGSLVYC